MTLVVVNWPISSPSCLRKIFGTHLHVAHADDRELVGQQFVDEQIVQRRNQQPLGQIAGRAEDHEHARISGAPVNSLVGCVLWFWIRHGECLLGFLLDVSAELVAHRGQEFVGKVGGAARIETFVERGGKHVRGDAFVNRRVDRPSTFT